MCKQSCKKLTDKKTAPLQTGFLQRGGIIIPTNSMRYGAFCDTLFQYWFRCLCISTVRQNGNFAAERPAWDTPQKKE